MNWIVLPWWGVFLVAPRSGLALRLASHGAVFIVLALAYGILLAMAVAGGSGEGVGLNALRRALSEPPGFLAGWAHYLCADLFIGAWILREARRIDVEPRVFLLLALVVGPLGLGGFLLRRAWKLRALGQLDEGDLV